MSFPDTRLTVIQRLATSGSADEWRGFMTDYWGPVCRFALRRGARGFDDAEDVAALTFEVLWRNQLLLRWVSNRSSKLRSLLCSVVRKTLANRLKVDANRAALARQWGLECSEELKQPDGGEGDIFYAAWCDDILQRAVAALAAEYYRQGRGDYLRTLYGRLCEQLTIAEVAQRLEIKPSDVDNYYRHARKQLAEQLQQLVREQTARYVPESELETEFTSEWQRLGDYLSQQGGLEAAVRQAYEQFDPIQAQQRQRAGVTNTVARLSEIRPSDL